MKKFYFDESGSITKSKNINNKYFIFAGISTNEPEHTKRIFKKAKQKYLKNNPDLNFNIKNEIKGSEMNIDFKIFLFEELIKKTDITFYFMIFDNHNAYDRLTTNPSITFNYINFLLLKNSFSTCNILNLNLDNRNVAIKNLKSLQDYLEIKFCIEDNKVKEYVKVEYFESQNNILIQIADIFSNFIYRLIKGKDNNSNQEKAIKIFNKLKIKNIQHMDYFPRAKCNSSLFG
ncbi:DUF3800 domain-containing protein [Gemella sp. zg-570]|uniref:DUF3800 domain-containing protein n=1 Tax=unclassified Gemella TaxID=2624949 RepID=UPI001C04CAD5|nr:DUF3800 domain-containing protein [Gemella sp. zg-570]MBU0278709.1 DUF3800 domain-containing protein [Gemella sp. zg-1178]QWQ39260.1 DUF3800 domain-containing protein [Gemella sp. zg-570]